MKLLAVSALALLPLVPFGLKSPAFRPGGAIPKRFTCDGADVSPPLRWPKPPARARGLALLVVDVSTPGPFVHWLAWGMAPRSRGLAAGARPPRQGRNDFGRVGWDGPCPPAGPLELRNGATGREFGRAVRHAGVLRQKLLVGTYRPHG